MRLYKFSKAQTEKKRAELTAVIMEKKPTHFLTVQFPIPKRSKCSEKSRATFRNIMKNFERQLLGKHWNNKMLPFIGTEEYNTGKGWHYHIYFYNNPFTTERLQAALYATQLNMGLTPETLDLVYIGNDPENPCSYCTKQIEVDINGHWDSSLYITSEEIFYNEGNQPKQGIYPPKLIGLWERIKACLSRWRKAIRFI